MSASGFTSSIDTYLFRNITFENYQKKDQDLSSFLYTIPPRSSKIPEFVASENTASLITLERNYQIKTAKAIIDSSNSPLDVVVSVSATPVNREEMYIKEQNLGFIKEQNLGFDLQFLDLLKSTGFNTEGE